ncbi:MAG TPA: ABC transporter substrate-binding protein [Baekduia sp.]|uniref:ABC transporter substrate-binding protein n=1 Tax=Baekduia sp. TaxID=2600305 RepID=UPI002D78F17F|nr:ABC transporter substrate-binding protein [Baekduia sp.]HET6509694.1 ABC transporter substrate-binding protein [Baekduia sp.]
MTLAAALAAAGCGSTSTAGGGPARDTLSVAVNSAITTADPAFACTTYDYVVVKNTYDNLVTLGTRRDANGTARVEPALADRWTLSADKRTYTFHLRTGVTFASGNPMTADDVVFSLKRVLAKEGCQQYVLTTGDPKAIKAITKVDDHAVRIALRKPDPLFLQLLAQTGNGVVDEKLLEQHGGDSAAGDRWLAKHTAGTGAYTLRSYEPDTEVDFSARKGYWGAPARASHVSLKIVTDPTTLETLVNSGDVDLAYGIPLKDVKTMKAQGKQVFADPSQFYIYVGLNNGKPPFDDVRVRQALQAALPAQELANRFGYGYAQAFRGPIPPAMAYSPKLEPSPPDLAKAKALLRQAGVAHAAVTLDVKSGETLQSDIATVLQNAYRPLGIDIKINTLGASAFSDEVDGFKSQMYIIKDGGTVNDPAYFLGYFVACGNAFNWVKYCNKKVDADLATGRRSFDPERRKTAYARLSAEVDQDAPYLPIFAPNNVVVAASGLKGYVYYDDQQPLFRTMSVGG